MKKNFHKSVLNIYKTYMIDPERLELRARVLILF